MAVERKNYITPMSKEQRFGITEKKAENFSEWYSQVLLKGNMHDYYDIRGCFIIRPQAMFLWKKIQTHFTKKIEELGVMECYFPMLITKTALEKEKDHLENFSPELAWITRCGEHELENPVAIRPTSETIMYPSFCKWLKSHRDLPLKFNQWCNVLRWEVKSTLPFIRGREFLWQEGHTAFLTKKEAEEEVRLILEFYEEIYRDLLAVPVIKGRKSENEKFGGAEYTLSVEAFIPETGKGVQGATSHFLGDNFSRMFNIQVESQVDGEEPSMSYVFQNSWGITTRSIGIAVMLHSDDKGLVLPPKIAMHQVVIIVCGLSSKTTAEEKRALDKYVEGVAMALRKHGIRVHVDNRDNTTPGYKFNYWEIQGVPLRIEIGFRDMDESKATVVRRVDGSRRQFLVSEIPEAVSSEIEHVHNEMYSKAEEVLKDRILIVKNVEEFVKAINSKNVAKVAWCAQVSCEESVHVQSLIKDDKGAVIQTGAKSLCILENEKLFTNSCFNCGVEATCIALFGRTY